MAQRRRVLLLLLTLAHCILVTESQPVVVSLLCVMGDENASFLTREDWAERKGQCCEVAVGIAGSTVRCMCSMVYASFSLRVNGARLGLPKVAA